MSKTIIHPALEEILSIDPVGDISDLTGKHHEQFTESEMKLSMGHVFLVNQSKSDILKQLNDTHFGMNWSDFLSLLKENGFVDAYSYEFDYRFSEEYEPQREMAILYHHPEKGLIIWATSYNDQTSVNGGKMYGEVSSKIKVEKEWKENLIGEKYESLIFTDELNLAMKSLDRCSHESAHNINKGISFSYDIREGLINKIHNIGESFDFSAKWIKDPFLWFLDFKEEKEPNYDYRELTLEKISKATPQLQETLEVYVQKNS